MKKTFQLRFFWAFWVFFTSSLPYINAQTKVSGFVRDLKSGERLIGAHILKNEDLSGTVSDNNGYFSLIVHTPTQIKISYIGYHPVFVSIDQQKDTLLEVNLDQGEQLDEVVIQGNRRQRNNVVTMKMQEISKLPSLGGKTDVLKSLQLLPGVMAQNEGSSLLLVRGGEPGQNLYLFDNAPVIYVNHLGGFMSVFNPDIISSIDLYKGGFPARYGGRLSSVMDISQRDGDRHAFKSSFSAGVTDLSFSVEGPAPLKNSSFILTGRKTLTDGLMATYSWLSESNDFVVAYGFHDLNGKFSWQPDDRNSFHFNLYQGDDYLNFWAFNRIEHIDYIERTTAHIGNTWGNWLVSGRWNRVVSARLFITNTLSYTSYRLNLGVYYTVTDTIKQTPIERRYLSTVTDLSYRANLKYQLLKSWQVEGGWQASAFKHIPNFWYQSDIEYQNEGEKLRSYELAAYIENNINLDTRFEANLGLRLVSYFADGYQNLSLEPRVRLNYNFALDQNLQFTYHRVTQNQQLLFTAGNIMNNEVWLPAIKGIEPANSEQFTFGWNGSFHEGKYVAEVTGYYKTMSNLATYSEGYSNLLGDSEWRNKVVTGGTGTSKGIEFLLKKQYGSFSGFVSYAYSRTTRQYPQINKGEAYIFDYDRPHSISLNIHKKLNEKWSFDAVWVYQTGLPYTPVIGRQLTLNTKPDKNGNFSYYETLLYGERNSARMKDYHRLDIGITLNTVTRHNRKAIWIFSVYNLYNRQNPVYYYYNTSENGGYDRPEYNTGFKPTFLYQMSFFPIIPSVSYKLYFEKTEVKQIKTGSNWFDRLPKLDLGMKLKIKATYGRYPGLYNSNRGILANYPSYNLDVDYKIVKSLAVGLSLGYSDITIQTNPTSSDWTTSNIKMPYGGLSVHFHPLDFFIKKPAPRFDFYFLGRYGFNYINSLEGWYPTNGFHFGMLHGLGMDFYLTKHLGIFGEGIITISPTITWAWRAGVSLRF